MKNRKVDVGFVIASGCVYLAAMAVRLGTADKWLWFVAGIIAGGFTWMVLRYAAFRAVSNWNNRRRPALIILILCLDLVCIPGSGVVGAVLLRGYPLSTTWQVLSETAQVWRLPLGIAGAFAIGVAGLTAYCSGRQKTDS